MDQLRLRMARMLSKVVRWAVVNGVSVDEDPYPVQEVKFLGIEARSQTWYPYGFNANAPNGTLSLMWAIGGDPGSAVHMPGSPRERVKVKAGEVVMYHPATGAKVQMEEDGVIRIDAAREVFIDSPTSVNITGGTGATVVAPIILLDGDVTVTGTLNVTGDADFVARVGATSAIDGDVDLAQHHHLVPAPVGPIDTTGPED